MARSVERMKQKVLVVVSSSVEKYTPRRLISELTGKFSISRVEAKQIVRDLIDSGELVYVYQYGNSFLEKSRHKPELISERVWLAPHRVGVNAGKNQVYVWLNYGGAFGTGRHPTTRLSIQAIDFVLSQDNNVCLRENWPALDVGTGTGVLAMVMARLGVGKVQGLDVESIARKEAMENVEINGLADRISISGNMLDEIEGKYGLLAANLRLPTLLEMVPVMQKLCIPDAGLVLSGIKEDEALLLKSVCRENKFGCIWEAAEGGWACQAYIKG